MVNIRTIERGTKRYYYLEHTIREGKEFKNKRIYLGQTLPKNIDEIKDKFLYELLEEMHKKRLIEIKNRFNSEYKSYPESYKKKYIEAFAIKFTYNTNRIEGGTLTLKDTADLLQNSITPKNKSVKELAQTYNNTGF